MKGIKEILIFLVIGIVLVVIELQFDRKPNDTELTNLLVSWYEDEILYQEALSKGFDLDDEIVRRRLIQKYNDFLKTQAYNYVPSENELKSYYEGNLVKYIKPFNISFSHRFYKSKDSNPRCKNCHCKTNKKYRYK